MATTQKNEPTLRLNLRVSGAAKELLDEMEKEHDQKSKDIILDALALYHLAVDEIKKGNRLAIRDSDGVITAIATPTLRRLAAHLRDPEQKRQSAMEY